MNYLYKFLFALWPLFSVIIAIGGTPVDGHEIKITVKGFKEGTTCILGNYYGDKQYIKDSAKVSAKGEVIFKGDDKYPEGVYFILPDSKKYFDLIMDGGQHFSIESDTANYIKHMKVKGSEENTIFFEYQRFVFDKQKNAELLRQLRSVTKDNDSIKNISDKLNKIDDEVVAYKKNLIKTYPKTFVAKLLTAMEDPVIPEAPTLPNGKKDTLFPYHYYKAHFFDNIDFSDERILYTPIFQPKITQYMEKMTLQLPDSINVSADFLVEKARANKEVFKYVVYWLTLHYESSKIMGMDAIFVHMVDKYYVTKQAYWVDSVQLEKITNRAYELKPILLGKKAPPITMIDSLGKPVSLYDVKGKYTVVIFWDEDCGHCKKEVPKLKELYDNKLKALGVQVYAISSENKEKAWGKFIKEHQLNWINVHQPDDYKRAVTKKIYDIQSTPYIYLLDENKIIKAKHIDVEQLGGMIDYLEKEKK